MQTSSSTDMVVDAVGKDDSKEKSKAGKGKKQEPLRRRVLHLWQARTCSERLLVQRHEREQRKGQAKRERVKRKARARTRTTQSRK